ncbi:Wortmanamides biosynthesis cluster C-like protein [Cladobotryum mycophilum]|uniref:Wortmanamides biosynthesis cluster C-like protein n=1 Tax=Cladobotryum mycophilum TaxID=491253 RepID=A0ABR0S952_9HYPO
MRHLDGNARDNLSSCIAMIIVTALAVMARFAVKLCRRQTPTGPDWMSMLSACLFYANCGIIMNFILHTSLDGSFDLSPARGPVQLKNILKMAYPVEIMFGFVISTVKLSILWFYYMIFASANNIVNKRIIIGTAAACVVWFFIATFVIVFQCNPIHAYWDTFVMPPYCHDTPHLLLGYEMTNLFLDIAILSIPVPMVWKLQLEMSKKISLIAIFLLGAFVCVASIIRLTAIWNPPDVDKNFNFSGIMMWSTLQMGIAITCACLPTLGPLLAVNTKVFLYLASWTTSLWSRSGSQSGGRGQKISDDFEMHGISN